jgi:hypothetical protein
MYAWVLTWEGTKGPALDPDKKIIAVLSGRRSSDFIADLVDVLYWRNIASVSLMSSMANKRRARDHQFKHIYSRGNRLFYGNNPCIFARLVEEFQARISKDGTIETVTWTDLPEYKKSATVGSGIEVSIPARKCKVRRMCVPIGRDIWE